MRWRPTVRLQVLGVTALVACSSLILVAASDVQLTAQRSPVRADLKGQVVVLDPGHNGGNAGHPLEINRLVTDGRGGRKPCNTTGTATDSGYPEHAFNFDVANRVAEQLTAQGVRVVLTRLNDTGIGPCVDIRGQAGQDAGADAVVSIHADGGPPAGRGFHVAYSWPPLDPVQDGPARTLAIATRDSLRDAGFPTSTYIGHDGLSERDDLAGLNIARRPAVLVECANMRNSEEAALISTPEGRSRYADAISAGIVAFLRSGASKGLASDEH